jgi:hypothetical protein
MTSYLGDPTTIMFFSFHRNALFSTLTFSNRSSVVSENYRVSWMLDNNKWFQSGEEAFNGWFELRQRSIL